MSKITDAVAFVITCGDEIFAIQRQYYLKAFPGYWAFPGGKIEKEDEGFDFVHPVINGIDLRHFGAVVREAQEELGIDLRTELLQGRIEEVNYLGLAVTPDFNPIRFSTCFFKIRFSEKIQFKIDANEVRFASWLKSSELLQMYDRGKLLAVPPVIKIIKTLAKYPEIKKIPNLNSDYDTTLNVPYIEALKSVRQIMPLSHTLPPAIRTNAYLIGDGDAPRVLIDPSPRDDSEYLKFMNTLKLFGVDQIMLTHHHPDHHERSTVLARELQVPMLMSEYTYRRLLHLDNLYFSGIEVRFLKEGDTITKWLGLNVQVWEVPGHDEGQLALSSEDLSWFIVGDLFQGVGTVVIGDEEGDMQKYFKTMERIIALNPKVVFPSHGIGLGGVSIIERTLEHRKTRENQVLIMYKEGLTIEQMLETIYADVSKDLWPYALKTIKKHLEKLRAEKQL